MAISSAMYAAVTGLSALSTGMQVISNNIANVNTVGFKAGRTNFEDLISQDYWTNGHTNQIGRGVKVASVQQMFTQGSFMNSAQDTDMAIAGEGFFQVRDRVTNELMYTRAGNFTFDKNGVLETPAGYVLQGWQLSVPKPGEDPVRIGTPTDVKVIIMNAPPVETSEIKVINNLDANAETTFNYPEDGWAADYAAGIGNAAKLNVYQDTFRDRFESTFDTWVTGNWTAPPTTPSAADITAAVAFAHASATNAGGDYESTFIDAFKSRWTGYDVASLNAATNASRLTAESYATASAQVVYQSAYNAAITQIKSQLTPWEMEGMGFAGAWDGSKVKEPISPHNYSHANPLTIYDSLGSAHKITVYYQPNPHMENVWDYIVTCDPAEDARKDTDNQLFMNGATFAGLLQKGKITFTAQGDNRHGGQIKDIEAQNLDSNQTKAAVWNMTAPTANDPTKPAIEKASVSGYYKGSPVFNPSTGGMEVSGRTYTIAWHSGNLPDRNTPTSGFTWTDNCVPPNSGTIPIQDRNDTGPYEFGSGLSVSFHDAPTPMAFGAGDSMTIDAFSESIGWTNIRPNEEGFFDFDVAFVQSASMALHPPYPTGLPTMTQHISMNMGARNPYGTNPSWKLDEQGTTQYATKSINISATQDGYPAGSLERVSIDKDGILTAIYSNNRHQPLYQIGLTRFLNPWGLAKLGDNVYMETRWSGEGTINPPGYGGTGTVRANFLEQSNVDVADEIVNMIVTQRGFQANSKVVTTTDTMLAEVIEMKR